MWGFIKKHWLKFAFFVFVAFIFVALFRKSVDPGTPFGPTPTPIPFSLINTFPPAGERPFPAPSMAITFTFSKAINLTATTVTVNPGIVHELNLAEVGKALSVYPPDGWQYDTLYTITIEARSEDGESLAGPIVYVFTPKMVFESDIEDSPHK